MSLAQATVNGAAANSAANAASTSTVQFDVAFNQSGNPLSGGSKFSYDSSTKSFSLDNPLSIGTLEELGTTAASTFFGSDFPDTSNIPVLGALLNKISFTIQKFNYTEANGSTPDTYDVSVVGDVQNVQIGAAQLTSATITLQKSA